MFSLQCVFIQAGVLTLLGCVPGDCLAAAAAASATAVVSCRRATSCAGVQLILPCFGNRATATVLIQKMLLLFSATDPDQHWF